MRVGTIRHIIATPGSGLMALILEENGERVRVVGDSGPTGRALIGIFGREIASGMTLNADALIGQDIGFDIDSLGLITALCPAEEV